MEVNIMTQTYDSDVRAGSGDAERIHELLFQDKAHPHRTFSPIERERLAVCMMLLYEKPVYVETLMEFTDVSRNTTVSDLKDVSAFLGKNKLKLHYGRKQILGGSSVFCKIPDKIL